MALSVNVTIAMPPEMLKTVDDEASTRGMSRAEYVRHLIQQAEDSPFEKPTALDAAGESNEGAA